MKDFPNDMGISAEISTDLTALKAVKEYMHNNKKMTAWIIIAIMLLYSYLTLLDVGMAENYENKVKCRENWLDHYDRMLGQLQELPISADEQELISGYDALGALIASPTMKQMHIYFIVENINNFIHPLMLVHIYKLLKMISRITLLALNSCQPPNVFKQ